MDELKKKVLEQTRGLPIEGDTKEEVKGSIKARLWDLECELDQEAKAFYDMVDKLDIPD